jgi:uncharacterized membrane protein YuzA (DUF378 family)
MVDLSPRPTPVRDAAAGVAKVTAVIGALITSLVGFGVLQAVQGDAVTSLLGAIPGLVTLVTAALGAFRVAAKAQPLVTPVSDPQNNAGVRLVPATRV